MCGRGRRRGHAATRAELPLDPIETVGERLERRAGVAARQADEGDLEHEARVGGIGAAHVDDGLTEGLEGADEQRGTGLLAERGEPHDVVLGRVHAHAALGTGEQEAVARGREQVLGDPAGVEAGVEQLPDRDQGVDRVLVGHRVEHAHAHLEVGAPEQRPDLLDVEGAVRDGLVEQREGVAHRSGRGRERGSRGPPARR